MSTISAARFESLRNGIYDACFAPAADTRRIGAEVELLARDASTGRAVPLSGAGGLIERLRRVAATHGWSEHRAYDGTPRFRALGKAELSFEPGGQIEISSAVFDTPTELVGALDEVSASLERGLAPDGVVLRATGIDPNHDAAEIPLQLEVDRYQRMTRYFDAIGPFGIRMMRQTAAIQISVDRGPAPDARWRLLNDLAPYLIAIFANSPTHAGRDTGHRSYRAHCWRQLDATRTGIAEPSPDAAGAYTHFALGARDMFRRDDQGAHQPFAGWAESDEEQWRRHLTTLFPEVRPRGHFEVRSCDVIPRRWLAAPMVFLAGLAYDERAARESSLLASESRALLRLAGERGLRDDAIARTSRDLFQLALDGAERLGPAYVSPALLTTARDYYAEYTARDRSPADDATAADRSDAATLVTRSPS